MKRRRILLVDDDVSITRGAGAVSHRKRELRRKGRERGQPRGGGRPRVPAGPDLHGYRHAGR